MVSCIQKDYVGADGLYTSYSAEAFKDQATADAGGAALPVEGGLSGKIRNIELLTGLTGNLAADAFGVLYADLKQIIVDRGWEASVNDIEDV